MCETGQDWGGVATWTMDRTRMTAQPGQGAPERNLAGHARRPFRSNPAGIRMRPGLLLEFPGQLALGQDVALHGQQELLLGGVLRQVQGGVQGEHFYDVTAGES